jgi:hypothetical protein
LILRDRENIRRRAGFDNGGTGPHLAWHAAASPDFHLVSVHIDEASKTVFGIKNHVAIVGLVWQVNCNACGKYTGRHDTYSSTLLDQLFQNRFQLHDDKGSKGKKTTFQYG